jgi:hypothetical protein
MQQQQTTQVRSHLCAAGTDAVRHLLAASCRQVVFNADIFVTAQLHCAVHAHLCAAGADAGRAGSGLAGVKEEWRHTAHKLLRALPV